VKLTVLLALLAVPINTVFGVTFAILLVRSEFRGKTLLMSLLDLPFSISPVVTGARAAPQLRALACTTAGGGRQRARCVHAAAQRAAARRPHAGAAVRALRLVRARHPRHRLQHRLRLPGCARRAPHARRPGRARARAPARQRPPEGRRRTGMALATLFVTLPFVVRELIPTLEAMDRAEEEAARTLGADEWQARRPRAPGAGSSGG